MLTTDQLESIQRLLAEPLRDAVRAEMQLSHDQLTSSIEKLADQLAAHMADARARDRLHAGRLDSLEHRVAALERFRARVLIVYGALTVLLSFAWSVFREWAVSLARRK